MTELTRTLFNTAQAAKYLNLKPQTLHNWRHIRKGPDYIKIGRKPMYELTELNRFIDAHRIKMNSFG